MEYSSALMHNIKGDVPIYPDRILFSEDLVNYIINTKNGIDFLLHGAERFRENNYNAFSEIVVDGVDKILVTESYLRYDTDELNTWDKGTYFTIAAKMEKMFLKEGLEPSVFLYFCVNVTLLAREFISNGLLNAPILAAVVIYATLINYDMFLGGWDSLNRTAKNIVNGDESLMTPNSSSPDPSESESQDRISQSSSLDDAELQNTDNDDNISSCESQYDSSLDDAEFQNKDKDNNISSYESQDDSNLHVSYQLSVSEDISISNGDRNSENLQLPDVSTGNPNRELIHNFIRSSMRETDEAVKQQDNVKDGLKFNEPLGDKYLRDSCVSANGRPLQQVCEFQNVAEDNETSTNGETPGANMYETSSTIIDRSLYFEYMIFRAYATLSKYVTKDN